MNYVDIKSNDFDGRELLAIYGRGALEIHEFEPAGGSLLSINVGNVYVHVPNKRLRVSCESLEVGK